MTHAEASLDYYYRNREKILTKRKNRRKNQTEEDRKKARKYSKEYYHTHLEASREKVRRYNARHRQKTRDKANEHHRKIRLQVLKKLGMKCICCGVTEWWNLTVDHVKPILGKRIPQYTLYRKIIDGELKKSDFQVLCHGCNSSKNKFKHCIIDHTFIFEG